MSDLNHVMDDLPAFALDLLDEEEAARVQAHLSGCPACREELRSYRETVGALAAVIPPAQPPERVKGAVLQAISQSKNSQVPQAGWLARLLRFLTHPTPAASLAGAALIVVLVIGNLALWQRAGLPAAPARAGFGTVPLLAEETNSGSSGMLVYTLDGDSGFLVVNHLPALSPDQTYQLWLIEDGQRTSGGIFAVDANGYWVMQIQSPQQLTRYDAFGITIEPAGGSPGPTGPKVLGGSF